MFEDQHKKKLNIHSMLYKAFTINIVSIDMNDECES